MSKTIAAIATAMAPGGIGVVRISGPEAKKVADKVFYSKQNKKISKAIYEKNFIVKFNFITTYF